MNIIRLEQLAKELWAARLVAMRGIVLLFAVLFFSPSAAAQQPPISSPLLEHLTGEWVLEGTILGKRTTHDVTAEWVVNHHYLRLHEVARDKTSDGAPPYEAFIHIGWNTQAKTYSILWLDNFWSIAPEAIGHATENRNELPFVWTNDKGEVSFSNVFAYDPKADSWEWVMDNVENGAKRSFGRVKLTRAKGGPQGVTFGPRPPYNLNDISKATDPDVQRLNDAYCAAYNAGDLDRLLAFFADEAVTLSPDQAPVRGSTAPRIAPTWKPVSAGGTAGHSHHGGRNPKYPA